MTETLALFAENWRECITADLRGDDSRLMIFTISTQALAPFSMLSLENKARYAVTYGYPMFGRHFLVDPAFSRAFAWLKIPLLWRYLHAAQWLFWSDSDSIVVGKRALADFIDEEYDLILSADGNGINTGQFFLRGRCSWTERLLLEIWDKAVDVNHPWWEQKSLMDLLANDPGLTARVKVIPNAPFNHYEVQPDTLIYHVPGTKDPYTVLEKLVDAMKERATREDSCSLYETQ